MEFSSAELSGELRRLRKGRGVQGVRIGEEIGPALRSLCGVDETDTHAAVREKVSGTLRSLSGGLPLDLRVVFVSALALDVDMAGKFLGDRVLLLAAEFHRDVRTIRRRVEEAIDLLAENTAGPVAEPIPSPGTDNWHVERLETLVRLDVPEPECIERRMILAERDIGDRIQVAVTPPSASAGDGATLRAVPFFGAEVIGEERGQDGRFLLDLRLPRKLSAGQRHEYGLVVTVPHSGGIKPHYVYFPERPCESFELRVKFPTANTPTAVRLVEGLFHRAADDQGAVGGMVAVDAVHEVHATFADLRSGYAYGFRWQPEGLSA